MKPTKDDENEMMRWALVRIAHSAHGQVSHPPMAVAEFANLALRFARADMEHRGETVRWRFEKWVEDEND